ncbi:MAG: thioredoxin-disulfide reductase [Clostridiales Family XIII bacterium]|nr:thioredoxin-disulfide reductase [Clostridiales Family XIII bacterium]
MDKIYDVIIVGGGPAGLSAAIYAGRSNLATLLIERAGEGGQIATSSSVENYPGGFVGEDGAVLAARMAEQCKGFGAEIVYAEIKEYSLEGEVKRLKAYGKEFCGRTVIIATGNSPTRLGVPGEAEFAGRGVSYCATCDGPFFKDIEIYVAGGGDSAVEEAIYLTRFAKKVTVIHRRDSLRASKSIQDEAMANEKISFMWDTVIKELKGKGLLDTIVAENVKTGEIKELHATGEDGMTALFVFVGMKPETEIFEGILDLENGYIVTDEEMRTNIAGVFAAGDVRKKSLRQVITAAADGAIAAANADRCLSGNV